MQLRAISQCRWDAVGLGEVMLRLDPGSGRVHTTRRFDVWEGGGEYNVMRGLRRCFGLRTAHVTALVDNAVGRLVEDLMLQGGVDLSHLVWQPSDGVGRAARNGLNFVERGFGPRAGAGCSDRGHTAISQLHPEAVDWQRLFAEDGARWFHSGGIFAALGEHTPATLQAAMEAAKSNGTRISYDLNYRPSLWDASGGKAAAQRVNQALVKNVDVLFGNEEDFSAALGFELEAVDEGFQDLETDSFRKMIEQVVAKYPNLSTVATTLRSATSASRNGWGAICWHEGEFFEVPQTEVEIFDRVGGGDSFASGFIYGLLEGREAQWALSCGVSHGALAMSTPGDTTMASFAEVERHMRGGGARIVR
jgi:2-dehydro-3-deoxygluconokinase